MTYYTLLIYVSLLIFDLLILNLVWRALKGPNRLTELSAAVVSFTFIAVAVVITFTALSTTVEAAKLTHPLPGKYTKTTKTVRDTDKCEFKKCSRTVKAKHRKPHVSKHGYGTNRPTRRPRMK